MTPFSIVATIIPGFCAFIAGAIAGSFFNVLIWRIPRGESIIRPRSYCPSCKEPILPVFNIPLLGFLLCSGKCYKCKNPISPVYPLMELLTAIFSIILFFHFRGNMSGMSPWNHIAIILQILWLLLLLPMAIIDFKHYIIPDSFTLPFIIAGIVASFIPSGITPLESLTGILAGGGSLFIIGWIGSTLLKKGDVMGGGDIKLMAAAGALFGWKVALISIISGAFLGSFVGVTLILFKKLRVDHKIPFGPFLGLGIVIALFWGDTILAWYLSFIQ